MVSKYVYFTGNGGFFPTKSFYSTRQKSSKIAEYIATSLSSDSEEESYDDDVLDPDFDLGLMASGLNDALMGEEDSQEEDNSDDVDEENLSSNDQSIRNSNDISTSSSSRTNTNRVYWEKITGQVGAYFSPPFEDTLVQCDNYETPLEYFKKFISDDILSDICYQTNLYALQKNPSKPLNLNSSELEQWLGVCMQMSVIKIMNTRLHWSKYAVSDKIPLIMPRKRWEDIKSNLHLVDNTVIDSNDKLGKIRPLVDHLRKEFQAIPMKEHLSVDEQMVPFKGASSMKQYLPKKPQKWGFKIFVRA